MCERGVSKGTVAHQDCSPAGVARDFPPGFLEEGPNLTDERYDGGYAAALAYFRAVETSPRTDEANKLAGDLVDEWGEEELMVGIALVAAFLRDALRNHAEQLGCDCGTSEWLDKVVYANAALDGHHG
jgi:hypothetical protein